MHRTDFEIVGAPFDLGSPARGSAGGPAALRERKLLRRLQGLERFGVSITDGGDVEAPPEREALGAPPREALPPRTSRLRCPRADIRATEEGHHQRRERLGRRP